MLTLTEPIMPGLEDVQCPVCRRGIKVISPADTATSSSHRFEKEVERAVSSSAIRPGDSRKCKCQDERLVELHIRITSPPRKTAYSRQYNNKPAITLSKLLTWTPEASLVKSTVQLTSHRCMHAGVRFNLWNSAERSATGLGVSCCFFLWFTNH